MMESGACAIFGGSRAAALIWISAAHPATSQNALCRSGVRHLRNRTITPCPRSSRQARCPCAKAKTPRLQGKPPGCTNSHRRRPQTMSHDEPVTFPAIR
jgi:hypothetical protein